MLYTCLNLAYSSSLKAAAGIPKQHEHIYVDKKLEAGSYKPDGQGPSQMLLTSCSDQTRRPKRSISTQAPEKKEDFARGDIGEQLNKAGINS